MTRLGRRQGDSGPTHPRRAVRLASAASRPVADTARAARRPQRRVRASQTLALAQRRSGASWHFPCAAIGRSQMALMRDPRAQSESGQLVRCQSRREMAATQCKPTAPAPATAPVHCGAPAQRRSSPEASSHRCVVDGGCMLRHRLGSALPMRAMGRRILDSITRWWY